MFLGWSGNKVQVKEGRKEGRKVSTRRAGEVKMCSLKSSAANANTVHHRIWERSTKRRISLCVCERERQTHSALIEQNK